MSGGAQDIEHLVARETVGEGRDRGGNHARAHRVAHRGREREHRPDMTVVGGARPRVIVSSVPRSPTRRAP